ALRKLADKGIGRLLVLPLYPQYSATTTASTFDAVSKELQSWRWLPEIRMVNSYHDFPPYVDAIAKSISSYQSDAGNADKLLFSFHGLPQHYFMAGDPYHCACHKTARLVAEKLALEDKQWAVSFQSRLGARPWLKPYTDVVLQQWAESGIGRVQVVCPGFSADCLETLEEVKIQYYELFHRHGGQDLQYIPALNSSQEHMDMMISLIRAHCAGWRQTEASQLAKSRERAISMGADQ
ncbi:MAG: ferrochelatase, partial [Candidatus Porifericomitaceae bacterium WSBS_2022_MAG_OTU9]